MIKDVITNSAVSLAVLNSCSWTFLHETPHKDQLLPIQDWFCTLSTGGNGCEWETYQTHFMTENFCTVNGSMVEWLVSLY